MEDITFTVFLTGKEKEIDDNGIFLHRGGLMMPQLYDRADIYDLIENEERTDVIRTDWEQFLGTREIKTFLDVSIGTGSMTLPLQELGITVFGSDLSEAMLSRCETKAPVRDARGQRTA